jgi:hypothetical protein
MLAAARVVGWIALSGSGFAPFGWNGV